MNSPAAPVTAKLRAEAEQLGFSLVGVCRAVEPTGIAKFHEWLAAGYAGEMRYLSERAAAYEHPRHVLDGVRSVVMLAMNYRTAEPNEPGEQADGFGRIARYAFGSADYHDLIHDRLHRLADLVRLQEPTAKVRGVVDTAPLLEREFAQLAGLGWIGKNTLLLNKRAGSWFFLAALLTDLELDYDPPHAADHCGTCRACLDACPTDAFPQPYVLDATRCISYLTIELRDAAPAALRPGIGDWLFGCDICQEVCPWNRRAPRSNEPDLAPRDDANPIDLVELFSLDDEAFRRRFRRTPLWRSKRRGILRNAAIVLGNQRSRRGLPALVGGLDDAEPLVRSACSWALGRYLRNAESTDRAEPAEPAAVAAAALHRRLTLETDDQVRQEIVAALAR